MKRFFIINPKSGAGKDSSALKRAVAKHFKTAEIAVTQCRGHAKELAAKAVQEGCKQIIVAGGDGTVNEAVQSLAGAPVALGVMAFGSGNGLARELGCPLDNYDEVCKYILNAKQVRCDLGKANGEYFINLAGFGLEADIAWQFDKQGAKGLRGKWPYFKIGAKEFLNYVPPCILVAVDGAAPRRYHPITMVFSNGRQYGSGFKIAPLASLSDGFLDMVIIDNTGILRLLAGLPNFFINGISPVEVRAFRKIKKAKIEVAGAFHYHVDGEPRDVKDLLKIEVEEGAITLLTA
jgi:YegS/Rv2252/BmrU family lipid kinase